MERMSRFTRRIQSMAPRLTIFRMGVVLVAVPILCQVAFILVFAELQRTNADAQASTLLSQEVLRTAQTVLRGMIDGQNGIRGYLLTGDAAHLVSYQIAARELPESLERLGQLVKDNPGQVERAEKLRTMALELLEFQERQRDLAVNGDVQLAIMNTKRGDGKRRMDAIRGELGEFLAEAGRIERRRKQTLENSHRRLGLGLIGGTLASIVASLALAALFSRGFRLRLTTLIANVRRLREGMDLSAPLRGSDEIVALDGALHDMAAELRTSEQALRRQTDILQSVVNSMGDGVIVADTTGKFLLFNPAASNILGTSATDTPVSDWSSTYGCYLPDGKTPYPPYDLPLARSLRGEAVDADEIFVRNERRPQGVWISVTGRPLLDATGEVQGGVVVVRDTTAMKHAEVALRQQNEHLEERVRERTAELAATNQDLAEKNRENEMFVYSVSHDLRSPLVNLQGFSAELALGCRELRALLADGGVPSSVRERGLGLVEGDMADSIRYLEVAVLRLGSIMDALLRLSRAGRVEYHPQALELGPIVECIVESMSGTAGERDATVTVRELPSCWGDPNAIEHIFANLIGNALNYLDPKRPGVVEIGSLDPAQNGEGVRPNREITYFVRDNGLGIPEAYRSKVFQAFQRVHPGAAQGEGMGLAIIQRVIERHGGRIWFDSVHGQGTTFYVALPTPPEPIGLPSRSTFNELTRSPCGAH